MPAGPGSGPRQTGTKSASRFGLIAAAILTAGLASAIVFRGDSRQAQQPPSEVTTVAQTSVENSLSKAPPTTPPAQPPSELPSFGQPGSLPTDPAKPEPDSFSSPLPFFSSDESEALPKISALQPYDNPEPAQRPATAATILPAANSLTPRLQPSSGQTGPVNRAAGGRSGLRGLTAAAAPVPCTINCKGAVSGTKTRANTLQGGKSFAQQEISTVYTGICEGKHVYDYTNRTPNKTIGIKVVTSGGETWSFTLPPGGKTSIKSSTEFTGGTFETYRTSEVMN
ncbi:MAG: hypothetical protein A2234_02335 [Elusimicrobia bacterium RIFOXYA2_FULL_58_8]|nr:MAG: hypothetical protein A2234_02335 [Elusimicrobia bacterium RIFOXYA2_FULL_58_8]